MLKQLREEEFQEPNRRVLMLCQEPLAGAIVRKASAVANDGLSSSSGQSSGDMRLNPCDRKPSVSDNSGNQLVVRIG